MFELEWIRPNRTTKGPFNKWERKPSWNQGRWAAVKRLRMVP